MNLKQTLNNFFKKERRRRKKTENSHKTLHERIKRTLRMRTTLSRSRRRIGLNKQLVVKKKKTFRVLSLRKKEKDRETIIEEENYYSRIKLES